MFPPRKVGLDWFCGRIRTKEPTTFTRWGDGEWTAVFDRRRHGRNCDGHPYFPKMGEELRRLVLGGPPYVLGMQNLALQVIPEIEPFLYQNNIADLDWIDADVFHHASGDGKLGPLVRELRTVPVVLVGPPHLHQPLKEILRYESHVIVPPQNCYLALKQIVTDTLGALARLPFGSVAAVSASMPAKLVIDQLYRKVGGRHHLIDFGSVWDFYAGVSSRKYMKGMAQGGRDGRVELRREDGFYDRQLDDF